MIGQIAQTQSSISCQQSVYAIPTAFCVGSTRSKEVGFWFGLVFNVPVNNFSVMLGRSHRFLSITSTFWRVNMSCSRTQHGELSVA